MSKENNKKNSFSDKNISNENRLDKVPKNLSGEAAGLIPKDVAAKHRMVAFDKAGNKLKVAMLDSQDIDALNALRFIAEKERLKIEIYKTSPEIFNELFETYASPSEAVREAVQSFKDERSQIEIKSGEDEEEKGRKESILKDAPVAKLVKVIIAHAIEGKASDIHIEPMEGEYRVRFRVDGILHVSLALPKEIGPVVVSRIKILANLKIDEKRKPQDGRFRLTHEGKDYDFRVSTLPVLGGEKVALRILDKEEGVSSLKELGLWGTAFENLKQAIKETYGMILITGPTGSGKSTTLYAVLKILNGEERNIVTLEDPVEYHIEGLNQSQVKPEIGYTFASGLRTILRQDPNVIMVGEIRDSETAELAIHAALTGHLVFSTLHTNTAIGAIPRLVDMDIENFLISSALRMVMAQRLVRMICPNCKEEEKITDNIKEKIRNEIAGISPQELEKYGIDISGEIKIYHGRGCEQCNGKGLKGRTAIFEVVPVDSIMRNIISESNGEKELLEEEKGKKNILSMRQDGILKALKGMTTLEEIERVTEGNMSLEDEI